MCPPLSEEFFLIFFDDADVPPEVILGREAAERRFAAISASWNAHLFQRIASNCPDQYGDGDERDDDE